jgi:hypothetical protein
VLLPDAKVDRSALEMTTLEEIEGRDLAYWLTRTPAERLEALELLRQIHYGYDPVTARVKRVMEVVEADWA